MKKKYEKFKIEIVEIQCDAIMSSDPYSTKGIYDINNSFDDLDNNWSMKKIIKTILFVTLVICLSMFVESCDNQNLSTSTIQKIESSNVNSSSTNSGLQNGGTYQGH